MHCLRAVSYTHLKQQTFTMEINKQNFAKKQMGDYLLAPLHGGVAFLILLAGFCGLTLYRKDCGRQIPFAVTGKWRREMSLFSIAVPVVLMTISGILSELLCGVSFLTIKEIASLLIYDIIAFSYTHLDVYKRQFIYWEKGAGGQWGGP